MPTFDFVLGGRYRLLGPLGEGGMASVYRGRDLRLNREVAIKVLREDLSRDPGFLQRFRQEAEFVARLSHPNIVPVYDVGDEGGSPFIVMEYIRGRTLKEALESNGPLPAERAVAILGQVLDALEYAHGQGIIHRDVKPQNILLTPDGTARLADFGIARLVDGSTTRTAAILGSAQYLSPEQSRGEEASEQSDLYACGIVLYEMLAGAPPFDGPNALAIANQHLNAPVPPISRSVGQPLEATIDRALAKDPGGRFPDAEAFAEDLRAAASTSGATVRLPLAAGEMTAVQPLVHPGATAIEPLAGPGEHQEREVAASPVGRRANEPRLEVRRSARKIYLTAGFLALLIVGAVYASQSLRVESSLPSYPPAVNGVVPGIFAAMLLIAWLNCRAWLYTMDGTAAVVQWGILFHRRYGVPVRYITALELKQSPVDRVLRVGTVELTARDQHGSERRIVLENLARPRETYEALMQHLGRTARVHPSG